MRLGRPEDARFVSVLRVPPVADWRVSHPHRTRGQLPSIAS